VYDIETLCHDFNITPKEIDRRDALKEYIHSLASVLIDEFYNLYVKPDEKLKYLLAKTDGAYLIKKLKEFIVFIITAPVDTAYLKRLEHIGFVQYSINLSAPQMRYSFWALNQLLLKLSEVNPLVKEQRDLISKFLFLSEFVINESYARYEHKHSGEFQNPMHNYSLFDDLFAALYLHQKNYKKLRRHYEEGTASLLDDITLSSEQCRMGKLLHKLFENEEDAVHYGVDLRTINALHVTWHDHFRKYHENIDRERQIAHIKTLTEEISLQIEAPLKEFTNASLLTLNSSIKVIRLMTEHFYFKRSDNFSIMESLESIKANFELQFSWAVASIVMQEELFESEGHDFYRAISFEQQKVYVGIVFKEQMGSDYLLEMLSMLFEVLEMNLKIQERELSHMHFADKAESANRAKDIFLANMSHELRTPLNAISGFSQILMMRPETPESVKGYVEKINIAGNNLLDLVNTILDFAKLESGKMPFNPQLSSLSTIVNEVQLLISPLAQKKSIALTFPKIQSLNLLLDASLFKQVLINLLSNAVKFTPEDGNVSLLVSYNPDERAYLFSVCDDGIGIAKEKISELFQPFTQVENSYQKDQKGTGLGLMISKKIIEEMHKGRISIESEVGKGSCFHVTLPIPSTESHTFSVNESEYDRHLLLVEDSTAYQQIIVDHLKPYYNITVTDTVNRAKELLVSNRYDSIILDFFLTDGISSEVLQFMDDEQIDIPCIVISAEDDINIAGSLSGFSNLESILNKEDVTHICNLLKNPSWGER
jgi:signal transduction histidine kinase